MDVAGSITGHTFVGYSSSTTTCGATQFAIHPVRSPDYTPFTQMTDIEFVDQSYDALILI